MHQYDERVKEISCLHSISQIVENPDISIEEAFQKTNDLLPAAWQYPEVTCSRITFNNLEYMTNNFKPTAWKQQANIWFFGKIVGCIEVCYLEEKATISDEGPFLKEERLLINHIAERLCRMAERKENEKRVRFQANMLNNVGQAVIMVDENRKIQFWNKEAENLYGWCEQEVIGKDILDITGNAGGLDSEKTMQRLKSGESWSIETLVTRKDGSEVSVILNRSPIWDNGKRFFGAICVITDVSELKQAERDLTIALEALSYTIDNSELLNEKLKVVGGLTRHDVRNKLSGIASYGYILRKKHKDEADIVETSNRIDALIKNITEIFDFSKMYEQIGIEKLGIIDVESAVEKAIKLFATKPNFRIINGCQGLSLLADSFLVQLFYNLLDNTQKYGRTATEVKISYMQQENGNLALIYEDNGIGISLQGKPYLFKEGHSTGGSTGLGLFFIKRMLDVYGWQIQENGEPGEGAKFVISIPKLSYF